MKNISISFIFLFIFSACEKDVAQSSSLPPSTPVFCGTGSFEFNGISQVTDQYLAYADTCSEIQITVLNGVYRSANITLHNADFWIQIQLSDTNGIQINQYYNGGINLPSLSMYCNDYRDGNLISYLNSSNQFLSSAFNGYMMITNLDTAMHLMSGNYAFFGHNSTFPVATINNGVFTDIPIRYFYPISTL